MGSPFSARIASLFRAHGDPEVYNHNLGIVLFFEFPSKIDQNIEVWRGRHYDWIQIYGRTLNFSHSRLARRIARGIATRTALETKIFVFGTISHFCPEVGKYSNTYLNFVRISKEFQCKHDFSSTSESPRDWWGQWWLYIYYDAVFVCVSVCHEKSSLPLQVCK